MHCLTSGFVLNTLTEGRFPLFSLHFVASISPSATNQSILGGWLVWLLLSRASFQVSKNNVTTLHKCAATRVRATVAQHNISHQHLLIRGNIITDQLPASAAPKT
jgi:hypothetical protein